MLCPVSESSAVSGITRLPGNVSPRTPECSVRGRAVLMSPVVTTGGSVARSSASRLAASSLALWRSSSIRLRWSTNQLGARMEFTRRPRRSPSACSPALSSSASLWRNTYIILRCSSRCWFRMLAICDCSAWRSSLRLVMAPCSRPSSSRISSLAPSSSASMSSRTPLPGSPSAASGSLKSPAASSTAPVLSACCSRLRLLIRYPTSRRTPSEGLRSPSTLGFSISSLPSRAISLMCSMMGAANSPAPSCIWRRPIALRRALRLRRTMPSHLVKELARHMLSMRISALRSLASISRFSSMTSTHLLKAALMPRAAMRRTAPLMMLRMRAASCQFSCHVRHALASVPLRKRAMTRSVCMRLRSSASFWSPSHSTQRLNAPPSCRDFMRFTAPMRMRRCSRCSSAMSRQRSHAALITRCMKRPTALAIICSSRRRSSSSAARSALASSTASAHLANAAASCRAIIFMAACLSLRRISARSTAASCQRLNALARLALSIFSTACFRISFIFSACSLDSATTSHHCSNAAAFSRFMILPSTFATLLRISTISSTMSRQRAKAAASLAAIMRRMHLLTNSR
mmetsp:Transcript_27237/g.66851  ORF Transcript_27237/g.66851 Transcript_27237/m.66851 type:complete len:576 (-) Transcript_27237:453-2180(-)